MWNEVGRVRALGIRGEFSDILAAETFDGMRAEHDAFEGIVIPRVGHEPRLTKPIHVDAIDRFLEAFRLTEYKFRASQSRQRRRMMTVWLSTISSTIRS